VTGVTEENYRHFNVPLEALRNPLADLERLVEAAS
jgi:hypothetical protein